MIELCLGLAFSVIEARLPATEFSLQWTHSVEKVLWEEDYRIEGDKILITAARIRGSGAGMEPPEGAVLRDGQWHYYPQLPPLDKLTLARSAFVNDYRLCMNKRCASLTDILGPPAPAGETVDIFPCP